MEMGSNMKTHKPIIWITALLSTIGATANAADTADTLSWNCKNGDYEISCSDGKCESSDAHTPMDIHVAPDEISICAYTACWTGAPSVTQLSKGFLTVVGQALVAQGDPENLLNASITIEVKSKVATVLVAGLFATPATCEPR
jgi:hypothetical protein